MRPVRRQGVRQPLDRPGPGLKLRRDRTGVPLVLAAASLGLPPLAVVSLAAGASGQRRWLFGVLCLAGRAVRSGVLVLPLAWL